jgi:hypothetical protein
MKRLLEGFCGSQDKQCSVCVCVRVCVCVCVYERERDRDKEIQKTAGLFVSAR